MDAIQFIKEKERMCNAYGSCVLCPACIGNECAVGLRSTVAPEQQINIVKEWSTAHPIKTRQSVFLEQYPEARLDADGVIGVCPASIVQSHRMNDGVCRDYHTKCGDCRSKFWLQEVE